jgi:hypothetical protein
MMKLICIWYYLTVMQHAVENNKKISDASLGCQKALSSKTKDGDNEYFSDYSYRIISLIN